MKQLKNIRQPRIILPRYCASSILPGLLLLLSWLPHSLSHVYQRFKDCAPTPYTCGNLSINVSYPFRTEHRPDYCGYPEYFLRCNDNTTLTVRIGDIVYRVKGINYTNHLLYAADAGFTGQQCPLPQENTTIDHPRYRYSDSDLNITFYFNCSSSAPDPMLRPVDCLPSDLKSYYIVDDHGTTHDLPTKCSSTVLVAVDRGAASKLESGNSTFGEALQEGFSVKWMAGEGWCSNCSLSGGRCGFDINAPDAHTCICPHGWLLGECHPGM